LPLLIMFEMDISKSKKEVGFLMYLKKGCRVKYREPQFLYLKTVLSGYRGEKACLTINVTKRNRG